jgi:hypothetical protein
MLKWLLCCTHSKTDIPIPNIESTSIPSIESTIIPSIVHISNNLATMNSHEPSIADSPIPIPLSSILESPHESSPSPSPSSSPSSSPSPSVTPSHSHSPSPSPSPLVTHSAADLQIPTPESPLPPIPLLQSITDINTKDKEVIEPSCYSTHGVTEERIELV